MLRASPPGGASRSLRAAAPTSALVLRPGFARPPSAPCATTLAGQRLERRHRAARQREGGESGEARERDVDDERPRLGARQFGDEMSLASSAATSSSRVPSISKASPAHDRAHAGLGAGERRSGSPARSAIAASARAMSSAAGRAVGGRAGRAVRPAPARDEALLRQRFADGREEYVEERRRVKGGARGGGRASPASRRGAIKGRRRSALRKIVALASRARTSRFSRMASPTWAVRPRRRTS